MSYKSCLTVSVLRSSSDVSFACFFVVLFMYILVGVLVNSLSEKLREIWNVFEGLLHLAWVCRIIRGFCLVIESRHLLLVCVDRCWLLVIYFEHVGNRKERSPIPPPFPPSVITPLCLSPTPPQEPDQPQRDAPHAGPRRAPAFVCFRVGSRAATPFPHRSDGGLLECLVLRRDLDSSAVSRRFLCCDWGGGQHVPPPTPAYPPAPRGGETSHRGWMNIIT